MPTFSSQLRFTAPTPQSDYGAWGTYWNTNMTLIEAAAVGNSGVSVSGASVTLSQNNGSADTERLRCYTFTGSPSGNFSVSNYDTGKFSWTSNQTSGGYAAVINGSYIPFFGNNEPPWLFTFLQGTTIPSAIQSVFIVPNAGVFGAYDASGVPQTLLTIDASNNVWLKSNSNGTYVGAQFGSGFTQAISCDQSGNVFFGPNPGQNPVTANVSGAAFYATGQTVFNGDSHIFKLGTTGSAFMGFFYNGANSVGSISTDGSKVYYNTTCDYRLKNILGQWQSLDYFDLFKVYEGTPKCKDHPTNEVERPLVLAHELAYAFPFAVSGEKDGEALQSVDYPSLIPALIRKVQELWMQVEALEAANG